MPRARRPWFRFYSETLHDYKIRTRPIAERWIWVAILALASSSPERGKLLIGVDMPATPEIIADHAAAPLRDVRHALDYFMAAGMVSLADDIYEVSNWKDRQYEQDNIAERVSKHRYNETVSNDVVTLQSHPLKRFSNDALCTETETETETSSEGANELIKAGARLIAERRMASRQGSPIANREAWLARVASDIMKDYCEPLLCQVEQSMTPEEVAELIEPKPQRKSPPIFGSREERIASLNRTMHAASLAGDIELEEETRHQLERIKGAL